MTDTGEVIKRADRPEKPYSFGELFKHEKYPNLIFALDDESNDLDESDEQRTRIWLSCWSTDEIDGTNLEEPINHFLTSVLKTCGCDKSAETILESDTFSLTHSKMVQKLDDYNLKQASFEEKKSLFELISDVKIRDILIEFNRKNNMLLSEFIENSKEDKDSIERKLNFLSGQGLLEKNLIVICKKTNQWWNMTIPSLTMLKELEKSGVTCTSCGAKITDERIDNLFKISERGAKLVNGSYWMVGKVVDVLSKLGVRDEDIFADVRYNGEQIDIMALYLSRWLVFELKDREFGLGDAYKFHGKISRLSQKTDSSIVPIIITTKTVAAEARKLLSEVAPYQNYRYRYVPRHRDYIFVEGLKQVKPEIQKWTDTRKLELSGERIESVKSKFPARIIADMI
jgi:hypothetical protein